MILSYQSNTYLPLTPEEREFIVDSICREIDYCRRPGDRFDLGEKLLARLMDREVTS